VTIDELITEVLRLDALVPDDEDAFEHLVQCLTVCQKAAPLLAAECERLRAALLTRDERTRHQMDAVARALGCKERGTYAPDDLGPKVERLVAENTRLRGELSVFAEHDCAYGDGCPSNAVTRHGTCTGCRARKALRGDP
jgi:hypothetical protein